MPKSIPKTPKKNINYFSTGETMSDVPMETNTSSNRIPTLADQSVEVLEKYSKNKLTTSDLMRLGLTANWHIADAKFFSYNGYEPTHTQHLIMSYAAAIKANVLDDLRIITLVGLQVGTNVNRYDKKLSPEAYQKIRNLMMTYRIVAKGKGKEIITMSRIMNAFPTITGAMLSMLGNIDGINSPLPFAYRFPGGASLIVRGDNAMISAYLAWAEAFNKKINPENKDPGAVQRFANIAHNSDVVDNDDRISFSRKYNTLSGQVF